MKEKYGESLEEVILAEGKTYSSELLDRASGLAAPSLLIHLAIFLLIFLFFIKTFNLAQAIPLLNT